VAAARGLRSEGFRLRKVLGGGAGVGGVLRQVCLSCTASSGGRRVVDDIRIYISMHVLRRLYI